MSKVRTAQRLPAAALAVATLLGSLTVVAASGHADAGTDVDARGGAAGRGATVSPPVAPAGVTPQGLLVDIAQHARSAAAEGQPGAAGCLHVVRWDRTPGRPAVRTTSIRWIDPDGSGLLLEQSGSYRHPAPASALLTAGGPRRPGTDPIPADPRRLAEAVTAIASPGGGSTAVVAVLLDLTGVRALGLAQRAAVVRVLAMLPGVTVLGQLRGRGGAVVYEFRFSDGSSADPIDVYLDPVTAEIRGYRLGSLTPQRSSTTTLIMRSVHCVGPPPLEITFGAARLRPGRPVGARTLLLGDF
ncbi:hypothetical protein [Dactylosporangium sp. NPDC005555]|uniref:hypothetical protein n=1 Tax=Dactylosporangium sp. NPDC005555 TaxID=3154889 RepID=UPI0033B2965C